MARPPTANEPVTPSTLSAAVIGMPPWQMFERVDMAFLDPDAKHDHAVLVAPAIERIVQPEIAEFEAHSPATGGNGLRHGRPCSTGPSPRQSPRTDARAVPDSRVVRRKRGG